MKFEFNKKKALKIGGIVLGSIVLLIAIVLIFFSVIAKNTIQTVGPLITGVPMKVDTVLFNAFSGKFQIKGLVVGNPKGYSSEYAFKLGDFLLDVDMSTLLSKKLHIEQIRIKGVTLNYETNLLNSNISDIQKNVDKLAAAPAEKEEKKEKESEKPAAGGKPLQINSIELSDITAWIIVKGTKGGAPIPVLPVKLNDLGTSPEGVTSAMVINDVLLSLITSLANTAGVNKAVDAISKGAEKTLKGLNKATKDSLNFFNRETKKLLKK